MHCPGDYAECLHWARVGNLRGLFRILLISNVLILYPYNSEYVHQLPMFPRFSSIIKALVQSTKQFSFKSLPLQKSTISFSKLTQKQMRYVELLENVVVVNEIGGKKIYIYTHPYIHVYVHTHTYTCIYTKHAYTRTGEFIPFSFLHDCLSRNIDLRSLCFQLSFLGLRSWTEGHHCVFWVFSLQMADCRTSQPP